MFIDESGCQVKRCQLCGNDKHGLEAASCETAVHTVRCKMKATKIICSYNMLTFVHHSWSSGTSCFCRYTEGSNKLTFSSPGSLSGSQVQRLENTVQCTLHVGMHALKWRLRDREYKPFCYCLYIFPSARYSDFNTMTMSQLLNCVSTQAGNLS